jgi:hypothetical protein
MSKTTTLAEAQLNAVHSVTVELVEADETPAVVIVTWPGKATFLHPRRFPNVAAAIVRLSHHGWTWSAPKDPRDRARQNAPSIPWRILDTPPSPQPPLPTTMPDGSEWPVRTRQWWAMWGSNPRTVDYHSTDWAMLLDTAVLHARFWLGDTSVAGELRLRVAKHGATPLDRARSRALYARL